MKKISALKQSFVLSTALLFFTHYIQAQNIFPSTGSAGIGTTAPDASSILETKSTTQGMLVPRMTIAQRNAIKLPATGLLIYQTNNTPRFYYYNGTAWVAVAPKGVNKSLSNLTPTAINVSMLPGAGGVLDLGSGSAQWRNAFFTGTLSASSVSAYNGAGGVAISGNSPTSNGVTGLSNTSTGVSGSSSSGNGVYGNSNDSDGVNGHSVNGNGVYGTSDYGYGVYGNSPDHVGVYGLSYVGNAIYGLSEYGSGVYGSSTAYLGIYGTGITGVYGLGFGTGNAGVSGNSTNGNGVFGMAHNSTYYSVWSNGDMFCQGLYLGSDANLKQNIHDFSSALDIINKLQPKQYEFRRDGNYKLLNLPQGNHYGLIAQDVEKILPNLIKDTKFDPEMAKLKQPGENNKTAETAKDEIINFKAMNYTELIPIMIKGMQEMSKENDELKKQNDVQQKQIDELKAMMLELQQNFNSCNPSRQVLESGGQSAMSNKLPVISSASLSQNIPNPFSNTTTISYSLPKQYSSAKIIVIDESGNTIKVFNLSGTGTGIINFSSPFRVGASYQYSLLIDGKLIDTKKMELLK